MVKLLIRTHKAEYTAGDIVYGVVYLKVTEATAASGLNIRFHGYETYNYCHSHISATMSKNFGESKEYLTPDLLDLCRFGGPIPIGSYALPFQKRLPMDLPGSCDIKSENGPDWQIFITYTVEVSLDGDHSVTDCSKIMVYQTLPVEQSSPAESPQTSLTARVTGSIPFLKTDLTVTLSLSAPTYYIGENIYLTLTFISDGKPTINQINVKLLNDIILVFGQNQCVKFPSKDEKRFSMMSMLPWRMCGSSYDRAGVYLSRRYVRPVSPHGPSVIWSQSIKEPSGAILSRGLHGVSIPLNKPELQPCSLAAHSMCIYAVEAEILCKSSAPITITLPIPSLRQKPTQWKNIKYPDWVFHCKRHHTLQPFTVPEDILDSYIFSSFPSFRTL